MARDLDPTETAVRAWVKQAQIDKAKGSSGALTTAEEEELSKLAQGSPRTADGAGDPKTSGGGFAKENS